MFLRRSLEGGVSWWRCLLVETAGRQADRGERSVLLNFPVVVRSSTAPW